MTDPSSEVLIVDDFLDEEAWTEVWTHFQFADLSPVSRTAGAWKLGDGVPLGGDEIVTLLDSTIEWSVVPSIPCVSLRLVCKKKLYDVQISFAGT